MQCNAIKKNKKTISLVDRIHARHDTMSATFIFSKFMQFYMYKKLIQNRQC